MNVISPDTIAALFLLLAAVLPPEDDPQVEDLNSYILRAKQQDREAVGVLYQTHVRRIYRYIAARIDNASDAEDLTAEVFVQMVQRIADYTITGAPFEAWLYRIAAARVADYYRRKPRVDDHTDIEPLPDDAMHLEDLMQHRQGVDELRRALRQLPEEYQTVLLLRFVERKSHADVAAVMDKSVTAVKSLQHRALTSLTELLGGPSKSRHYLRGERE